MRDLFVKEIIYSKLNRDKIEELRLKIARLANIDERKIFLDTYGISLVSTCPKQERNEINTSC